MAWAATQRQTEMVDNTLQACGAARVRLGDGVVKPFGEYLPRATRGSTPESPNRQDDPNATAVCRQIS
jgi:hypothetical protein